MAGTTVTYINLIIFNDLIIADEAFDLNEP
jgi:hypothetical protein